jgi:SAM-dependent methyltransferase
MTLVCIQCRTRLTHAGTSMNCPSCGRSYPIADGIVDFAVGEYYDSFDPERDQLSATHLEGLSLEIEGSIRRMRDFYIPLIRETVPDAKRVLDAGCGNGVSVDILRESGFDAWGNDLSELRKHQWKERASRESLVVASALRLPFEDDAFDVVISSGVIEHIGVIESPAPNYGVRGVANQRELRVEYLRELGRVVRPEGRIFLDCPHGSFPIDFWHGNRPGTPRLHSPREPFLPSFGEVKRLAAEALGNASVRARSPHRRLQFKQAAGHLHGRLLSAPFSVMFRLMNQPGFRWLAGTALNPFLVVEIRKAR